jgi:hypothetical protein
MMCLLFALACQSQGVAGSPDAHDSPKGGNEQEKSAAGPPTPTPNAASAAALALPGTRPVAKCSNNQSYKFVCSFE